MLIDRVTGPPEPVVCPATPGRARAADVIAVEPVRLLALDWQLVGALMDNAILFREMVEQVARERLSTL